MRVRGGDGTAAVAAPGAPQTARAVAAAAVWSSLENHVGSMRFVLRTAVGEPPETVFPVFGEPAFVESLAPRLMGLRVERIGLALGDEIEVRFTGLGPRGAWVSRIVELEREPRSIWFTDHSIQLPRPFSAFRHHHGFEATDGGTTLVDDVTFSVRPRLLAPFVYPVLRLSFAGRRRVYRRRFGAR